MPMPTEIRKLAGGAGLKITWSDGGVKEYPARALRQQCKCAMCQHELTGEALLKPDSVPANLTIFDVELLGQYAVGIRFSDGHSTGIYTFQNLYNDFPAVAPHH